MLKMKKRQTGFGLLELMLSMVIVALLLIMATRYYQSARSNARVNQAIGLIGSIVSAANGVSLANGNYSTISDSTLIPYLSPNFVSGTGKNQTIQDPWGNTVTVTSNGATNFTIALASIPTDDCTKLSNALGQNNKSMAVTATCDGSANTISIIEYLNSKPSK